MPQRILFKSFNVLVFSLLLVYLFPFVLTLMKRDDFEFNILKQINNKVTSESITDLEKANTLFQFTCKTFKSPSKKSISKTKNGYSLLMTDSLWCDEQCNILTTLAEYSGIKGRIIFLKGNQYISKHSVCELYINNKYCMYDPFYQLKSTKSVNELNVKNTFKNTIYKKLYERKFPHKFGKIKQTIYFKKEHVIHSIFSFWFDIFGDFAFKPYLKVAYRTNQISKKEQIKINRLFFQSVF